MAINSFYSKGNNSNSVVDSMIIGRNDQRGFLRMDVNATLTFKFCGADDVYEGASQDLSATGLRFVSPQKVSVGDMLDVCMKPGIDITPPLETTLAVVRVTQTNDGQYEVAGVLQQNDPA
ncbi:hypothetical protein Tel_10085 [Candidatus Tenderia electrophaga]|jgi:hypothetical protein|uniref:PilZ domain-containing protein n=1 Tax=Candidatus Tenderia electrophaga TaxID=1748243 RepID=A0A0S2TEF0_9GAMM|nr:hypothetical protein Tel_10085 [Candidatus Tenderia electrophaga]